MTSPLLAIENLSIGFRQQQNVRPVVNAISLQVNAGETLALRWRVRVRKKRHGTFHSASFAYTSGRLSFR
ncbi:ABC-transporter ATP-binding protein [Salmonella bongori]|nr:ABC-transporter ATP-binding protein [Salmonella bongori]